jgi:hypothetical protein
MRKIQLCLLALTVLFAAGCPKPHYRPSVSFDRGLVDKFNAALKQQYREYECYRFGATHIDFQGHACTGYTQNFDNAKAARNELIENALPYIDESYMSFVSDLQAGRDRNNFLLDLVELGTAASVGITKGERPLQIIGVALTAFRGGRKSMDANFYKDTSTPILISKMDGNRAKVRATILEREAKKVEDYSLGAAVSDIVDYYNAGTLVRAFTQLQQDTAIATEASETHLKHLKEAGVKGAPTAEQLKASKDNAKTLRALRKPYTDADKNIEDAKAKITQATQDVTNAATAITDADQKIGEATAKLAAAKNDTEKALAQAALATANAAKATALAKKSTAEGEQKSGETAKAAAVSAREQAFKKLQGIYEAIAANSKLSPLLEMVPNDPSLLPAQKAALQTMLQGNKSRNEPETDAEMKAAVDEYYAILLGFSQIVAAKADDEPELNERLQEILKANK